MVTLTHNRSAAELPTRTADTSRGSEVQAKRQLLICLSLLYTTILFSILAVPAGAKQLPISLLTGLLHFGLLAVLTRFAFDPVRLVAVSATFIVITLETALVHHVYSPTSLFYVPVTYLPLALTLPLLNASDMRTIWRHVSILATIIACLGLIQMAVQIVVHGYYLDPLRMLPAGLLLQGYNTTYPIAAGETLLKPNGMVLLEPSFFSQMVAFGLLSELVFFKRKGRILLLLAAIAASFSGTGLLMLLPALLFLGSIRMILSFAVLAAILVGVVAMLGYGNAYLGRATETQEDDSSGHARFVEPYKLMFHSWQDTSACLFGRGAGVAELIPIPPIQVNFSPVSKVGVEYGIVGLIAFSGVWISFFGNLALPKAILIALLIFYFAASGAFLQPFTVFTIWAVTAGFLRSSLVERSPSIRSFSPQTIKAAKQSITL
jgi:hypothetical protein